ncbi:MAG: hypothetical protein HPKKFMNG_01067 [Planctomycetes bacterium]|nr:hypothetical protein [Planctomycetota bacterium]
MTFTTGEPVTRFIALCAFAALAAVVTCLQPGVAQDKPDKGEPVKLPPVPTGEVLPEGVRFEVPYPRGKGYLTLSRQNGYLRVDAEVHLLYNAGDGDRSIGSAVALVLSVDGYNGRILMHYPNAVWVPKAAMPVFRYEKTYTKESAPVNSAQSPGFAASSNVCFTDRWTTTYWVNLRRLITAGNTPDSPADHWRAAFHAGDSAAYQVFPEGVNGQNPAITPDRMFTFKFSTLPQRQDEAQDPMAAVAAREDSIYKDIQSLLATFSVPQNASQAQVQEAFVKGFAALKTMGKAYPDLLLVKFLLWQLGLRLGAGEGVDPIALLKDYLDACPSQLRVHVNYIDTLIRAQRKAEALKHIDLLLASDMAKGHEPTRVRVHLDMAPLLIDAQEAAAADKVYDAIKDSPVLNTDLLQRLRYTVGASRAAAALGNREREAALMNLPAREPGFSHAEVKPLVDYARSLFQLGYEDEGVRAAEVLCGSPWLSKSGSVHSQVRIDMAEYLLRTNYAADKAFAQYEAALKSGHFATDDVTRFGCYVGLARCKEAQGDMKAAAEIYRKLLETEQAKLTAQQVAGIKQLLEFQTKGQSQWEEELKFIDEDAKKQNPRLTLETTKGNIVVELFEDDAPNTVASLVSLTQKGFYNNLSFHRFEPNFVIQGGCPLGNGTGSGGYRLKSEVSRRNHFMGTFAMACSQPKGNTEGSQFYICTSNGPNVLNLSGSYVVAGRVIEGMDVARRLRAGDRMVKVTVTNLRSHEYKPETLPERR